MADFQKGDPRQHPYFDPAQLEQIDQLEAFKPGLRNHLVGLFKQSSAEQIQHCADALAQGDSEQLRRAAHALKGVAASLGARQLSLLAADLEREAAAAQMTDGATRLAGIRTSWSETLLELERWTGA